MQIDFFLQATPVFLVKIFWKLMKKGSIRRKFHCQYANNSNHQSKPQYKNPPVHNTQLQTYITYWCYTTMNARL